MPKALRTAMSTSGPCVTWMPPAARASASDRAIVVGSDEPGRPVVVPAVVDEKHVDPRLPQRRDRLGRPVAGQIVLAALLREPAEHVDGLPRRRGCQHAPDAHGHRFLGTIGCAGSLDLDDQVVDLARQGVAEEFDGAHVARHDHNPRIDRTGHALHLRRDLMGVVLPRVLGALLVAALRPPARLRPGERVGMTACLRLQIVRPGRPRHDLSPARSARTTTCGGTDWRQCSIGTNDGTGPPTRVLTARELRVVFDVTHAAGARDDGERLATQVGLGREWIDRRHDALGGALVEQCRPERPPLGDRALGGVIDRRVGRQVGGRDRPGHLRE